MEIYARVLENGNLELTTHEDFIEELKEAMPEKDWCQSCVKQWNIILAMVLILFSMPAMRIPLLG